MGLFGKKQDAAEEAPQQVMNQSRIPTDKVLTMRSQGLSNNQIITTLQRDGFDLPSIFNAMNQADIKNGVDFSPSNQQGGSTMAEQPSMQQGAGLPEAPMGPDQSMNQGQPPIGGPMGQQPMDMGQGMQGGDPGMGNPMDQGGMQPMGQPMGMPMGADAGMGAPMDQGMAMQPMGQPMDMNQGPTMGPAMPAGPMPGGLETQRIEELAEAIIDEKWNEIVRSINKIIDWKERVEARVNKLEQRMDDMQKNFDLLHKGVIGKIHDYDENLQNVGSEIKAMEKVFQKVLPSLTENVSELSRITKTMKK